MTDDQLQRLREIADSERWLRHGDSAALKALLAERERLAAVVAKLPTGDDIELGIRANNMGGLEFRQDYCQCDPDVGACPCPYCAIDMVLWRMWRAVNPEAAEAARAKEQ